MKKVLNYSLALLLTIGLFSCEKEDPVPDYDITGLWDIREIFVDGENRARQYNDLTLEFFNDNTFHLQGYVIVFGDTTFFNGYGDYQLINSQKKLLLTFTSGGFKICSDLDYEFAFTPSQNEAVFNAMQWLGECSYGPVDIDLRRK